jgi:hypothetical protein
MATLPSDAAPCCHLTGRQAAGSRVVMPCPDRHARLQIVILIIISLPVSPRAFTPPSSPRVVDGARPVVGEERGGDTCPWLFVVAAASARILADEERRCPVRSCVHKERPHAMATAAGGLRLVYASRFRTELGADRATGRVGGGGCFAAG